MPCLFLNPAPTTLTLTSRIQQPFFSILEKKCSNLKDIQQIHALMITTGFIHHTTSLSKLVSLSLSLPKPTENSSLAYACMVFNHTHQPNIVIWNAMIRGFVTQNLPDMAILAYADMIQESETYPDRITFPSLLKACTQLLAYNEGKILHGQIFRYGLESDPYIQTTLITMYAACGDVFSARAVFDQVDDKGNQILWSSMICGYVRNQYPSEALHLFTDMEGEGQKPDEVTIVSALSACAELRQLDHGMRLHSYIEKVGMKKCVVLGTTLLDMYAKCEELSLAREVFDMMPERNVVTWSAMIAGYTRNNRCQEALVLFKKMVVEADCKPNEITISGVLSACAQIGDLDLGRWVHSFIGKARLDYSISLQNSLIDMYSKCGKVDIACQIFYEMVDKDIVSWNAMISGLALHGRGEQALAIFSQMQKAGFQPDDITFIGVLSACSHACLVEEGYFHYHSMNKKYEIVPKLEHYACMVDLLSRAGMLDKAENFIRDIPMEPNAAIWGALLSGCRVYDNVELGEKAAKNLLDIEPYNGGVYILLSNIFARKKQWEEVRKVRALMHKKDIRKTPGCSLIVVKGVVHEFMSGDHSNAESKNIYLQEEGYIAEAMAVF